MKRQLIRITVVFCFMLLAVTAMAGTWSANNFFYQPALDARGPTEKNNFDTGLNRVDTHLGQYKTLGDPSYSTLAEALTTIGSSNVTLTIPAGTVAVASNTAIGSNISLRVFKGGIFSVNSGVTLTINGPIEAGPYQIFSGTGTVTLGGVSTIYDVWYASPPSTPQGVIAAPVGSRFIKTAGSPPLVYVKESGTGTTGWVASSGSGSTTFTGLTDVPSSYSGQAGKSLRVNTASTALEFYTPSAAGGSKPFITLGELGYTTLSEALTTIGSTSTTLVIPTESGVVPVTSNTTIPANVDLRIMRGGRFDVATGVTLTINGPIEAGSYQIFSWTGTGTINISGSPTTSCPITWWGAVSDPWGGPYEHDNSSAWGKAIESTTSGQEITFPDGVWRIATPLTITKSWGQFKIRGSSTWGTQIYIDVGSGNMGIDIGALDGGARDDLTISNLSFVGPSTCCSTALRIRRVSHINFDNVNFWVGSTGYALVVEGCVWAKGDVRIGQGTNNYFAFTRPHDGIRVASTPYPEVYQSNVVDLRVMVQGMAGTGVFIDGGIFNSGVTRLTGSIEACQTRPLNIYNQAFVSLKDLYLESNTSSVLIDSSANVTCDNLYGEGLQLTNCENAFINNFSFYPNTLEIDASCRRVTVGAGSAWNRIVNNAPDTKFLSVISSNQSSVTASAGPGNDNQNILYNSQFTRWTSTAPDGGWNPNTGVATKCGTGLSDTTKYNSEYCMKLATNGDNPWVYLNLDSPQINQIRGKSITLTVPMMISTTETVGGIWAYYAVTIPTRANSTAYKVGDAVAAAAAGIQGHFICTAGGTTASSEPILATSLVRYENKSGTFTPGENLTWSGGGGKLVSIDTTAQTMRIQWNSGSPPTTGTITGFSSGATCSASWHKWAAPTDGTVTWRFTQEYYRGGAGILWMSGSDNSGVWKRNTLCFFVPRNCTGLNFYFIHNRNGSTNFSTYYGNPCLMVGSTAANGSILGQNEFQDFFQLGPIKVTHGTVAAGAPTGWRKRGDWHFYDDPSVGQPPGLVCTADGNPGTWKKMGNLTN